MFNLERVDLFQVIKTPFRKNIDMQLLSLMLVAKYSDFTWPVKQLITSSAK